MATYKASEYRAITWYAQEEGLRLSLCQRPYVYYQDSDGEIIRERLSDVFDAWESHKKAEARIKARQRS